MTTFVSQRVSNRNRTVAPARRIGESFTAVRGSLRDWGHAFQAAGRAPRREGMDFTAMLMFGRD
jgi:hypothetical protein